MGRRIVSNVLPGLSTFKTGSPRTGTAPTDGSKTQRRKVELKSYNSAERINGRKKA